MTVMKGRARDNRLRIFVVPSVGGPLAPATLLNRELMRPWVVDSLYNNRGVTKPGDGGNGPRYRQLVYLEP